VDNASWLLWVSFSSIYLLLPLGATW
jgi:hypothetical protein